MKKLLPLFIGLSISTFASLGHAEDLLQVYQQAKQSNPDLRKSLADRNSAYEKINQSRGSLLPQLGFSGGYGISRGYRENNSRTDSINGSFDLKQSLFDFSIWKTLSITEKQASVKDISYSSQEQTLMLDTAKAYFDVLQALDTLTFSEARKKAIGQQLEQTKQRFNVGLVAITDVYTAQAEYDKALADEVTNRNTLDNTIETLRLVTGMHYTELGSLDTQRFNTKKPNAINLLLNDAEKNNLQLMAARMQQEIAREQIRLAQSGHMPTVGLNASSSLGKTKDRNSMRSTSPVSSISGNNTVTVNMNIPIYSGGAINSAVKQAQYDFVSSSEALESTHRKVIQSVRSSYNNIVASISTVQAYKQAVVSAESSLESTKAGYNVGTRTIVDVLNATTALYQAKQQLSTARYTYLVNQLNVKSALGTLNEQDLELLNQDLGDAVSTAPEF